MGASVFLEINALEALMAQPNLREGLAGLLQPIVDGVLRITGGDRATLILFDWEAKQVLHFLRGGAGWDAVISAVGFEELSHGLSGWCLRTGKVALSLKDEPDPREGPDAQARRRLTGCGSILVAPLGSPGAWLGTITAIGRPDQVDFTEEDAKNLLLFTSFAAVVVRWALAVGERDRAYRETENAIRSKISFLANLSHELRTPLNGILGFSHLLESTGLSDAQRPMVDTIATSGQRLLGTIDNILDLAQFESGQFRLERAPFSPRAVLEVVLTKYVAVAREKGLEWVVETSGDLPNVAEGDAIRLGQAWGHLVSNAVKFTNKGSVTIRLEYREVSDTEVEVTLAVSDTGVGLSAGNTGKWFMPFHQEDGSLTRKFGGTGLGLALCDRIVRNMQGGLSLLGEPGKGTTARAWVTLGREGSVEPSSPGALRILIQDPDPVSRLVLVKLVESLGHRADVVATLSEAENFIESTDYEILIVDSSRSEPQGWAHLFSTAQRRGTHLVGLAAGDTEASSETGPWTAVLVQPVTHQKVMSMLRKCSSRRVS